MDIPRLSLFCFIGLLHNDDNVADMMMIIMTILIDDGNEISLSFVTFRANHYVYYIAAIGFMT
jgi:hypothetical protein